MNHHGQEMNPARFYLERFVLTLLPTTTVASIHHVLSAGIHNVQSSNAAFGGEVELFYQGQHFEFP